MGAGELEEWIQYALQEPFALGENFSDACNALLCSVVHNSIANLRHTVAQVGTKKRQRKPKMMKPKDFLLLPQSSKKKRKKTGQEMLSIVEMLNEAFGGKDLRKDK